MFVLAIDTSTPAVTAGVVTVGPELALAAVRAPQAARGHGELLAPAIAACLADLRLSPRDIGAVVAGVGPGPYTGLRVGLVTAAAFADAIGVPTYAVCSLDAVATGGAGAMVVTDARRREVYWARYDERGERLDGPQVDHPHDVPFAGVPAVAGPAVELYDDVWPAHVRRLADRYPEPLSLVARARDRIESSAPADPLTPLYLRRPDAVVPGAPKTVSQ